MPHIPRHPWQVSPSHARVIQDEFAPEVERSDQLGPIRHVAGADIGFEEEGSVTRAALVVLSFPDLKLVEHVVARRPTRFPYVPGLLSFREIPALLMALDAVRTDPDLILCDGQGIAHPRRFGLACHLGVLVDRPTIGVAKQRLIGRHQAPPPQRGAWTPLVDKDEAIGAVLRSRVGTNPLFVSIGHRVSLETAVRLTMACTTRFRLPETTRLAHHFASTEAGLH